MLGRVLCLSFANRSHASESRLPPGISFFGNNQISVQETMSNSLHAWLSETGGGLHPNICFTQGAIYRHSLLVVDYLTF